MPFRVTIFLAPLPTRVNWALMHFSLSKAHVFFKTCEQSERYLLHSDSSTILYILYFSFSPMPPIQHFSDKSLNYIRKFLFVNTHSEKISDCSKKYRNRLKIGRSGEAQTRGLRIPNAARYQLRYTPIVIKLWSCKWSNLWSKVFCRNTRRRKSEETREKRRFCELSEVVS